MSDFHFSPRPNRAGEIHWQAWGARAFEEAVQDDKPILLDISAVWCHWCHVMDETTYSDPEVIRIVNERFIPVRVDTDERPDVNRRYNLGGWPTTAFLAPDGELLTGGTYMPAGQMRSYLTQLSDVYRNSKADILTKIAEVNARRNQATSAQTGGPRGALSPEIVQAVLREVQGNFDSANGGFGDEPKFPSTDALELALEQFYTTGDPTWLNIVQLSLSRMAGGGLYDQVAGGFFRYSTTRDWSIPHYEKMLEDNAKLLALYVHAYQVTGDDSFLQTIRSLIGYVDDTLCDRERGGFYGSQDADETYYTLPRAEREKVPAPYVDRTLFTDWNALMVSACLVAAEALRRDETASADQAAALEALAFKTLDRLWAEMYRPDEGLYHSAKAGAVPQLADQLADLGRTTGAFLDAYQATGDNAFLERAQVVAGRAIDRLFDRTAGVFRSEPPTREPLGLLRVPDRSMTDNAVMAQALIRLFRLTGDEQARAVAEAALSHFAADYARASYAAAEYALAVGHLLSEPVTVHIVGAPSDPRTLALQAAALDEYSPDKIVQLLDPARDAARLAHLGYGQSGTPLAYVCVGTRCLAPVADPKDVVTGMREIAN